MESPDVSGFRPALESAVRRRHRERHGPVAAPVAARGRPPDGGLPDEYKLPANVNEALGPMGDGVAVPVVRFLAENLLEPLLSIFAL
jgi:hypothetical protein